ncbi:Pentatricopeptide repeat-containing protein [Hibiscus syriacus]|uniref:Pentatricopeptide repeat-containing protein n=1 Tax=Hibiscus syriacus TaxID=106335 RepID=A0A6A3CWR5_HIBSY|nr:Pentatricopeptide repeat-containing protein [Hibiscus syriacus]
MMTENEQLTEASSHTFANKRINVCLTDSTYLLWKQQVILTIRGLGLESFLDESMVVPAKLILNEVGEQTVNPAYLRYVKQDSSLAYWLLFTVSTNILPRLVGVESTAKVWNAITRLCSKLSTIKIMALHYIDHIATILNGLPVEYEPTVTAIIASRDLFALDNVVYILIDAESRLDDSSRFPIGVNFTRYNTNHVSDTQQYKNCGASKPNTTTSNKYKGRPKQQCKLCRKLGHLVDRCWHRFDQVFKGVTSRQSSSPNDMQVNTCSCFSHTSDCHYSPFVSTSAGGEDASAIEPSDNVQVNALMTNGHLNHAKWFPDLGAIHHVTGTISIFSSKQVYTNSGKVHLGDDSSIPILHIGKLDGGLYIFYCQTMQGATTLNNTVVRNTNEYWLWHKRLGHQATEVVMTTLNKRLSVDKSEVCATCQMGKSKTQPFPISQTVYKQPFELVEVDVWGPALLNAIYLINMMLSKNLGYSPMHHGYQYMDNHGIIYVSRSVVFNERIFPFAHKATTCSRSSNEAVRSMIIQVIFSPHEQARTGPGSNVNTGVGTGQTIKASSVSQHAVAGDELHVHTGEQSINNESGFHALESATYDSSQHEQAASSEQAQHQENVLDGVPGDIRDALQDDDWRMAVMAEYNALISNNTWDIVELPAGRKAIGCKWLFKVNKNVDDSVERMKARLVAKRYSQIPGYDFMDTFSPVAGGCEQCLLKGDLIEDVYMQHVSGFEEQSTDGVVLVCKLKKTLYGLRQALRNWFLKLREFLLSLRFKPSRADSSQFIRQVDHEVVYMVVYVDDILITGSSQLEINQIIHALHDKFSLKDLGQLKYFLGIEVHQSDNGLFLSQKKFFTELLQKNQVLNYRSVVGVLQYIFHTRPDISFAVNKVSQFLQEPTEAHWLAVKCILRYLQGTLEIGLWFSTQAQNMVTLNAFLESDWGGDTDDRRSISRYCVYNGNHLLAWSSKNRNIKKFKVFPDGYMVAGKKWRIEQFGFYVVRSSSEMLLRNRKYKISLSSDEILRVLKSISDPKFALAYFESVAELPNIVHITKNCNHMLEVLRVHGMVGKMSFVFEFMQKQIIKRDLNTYLIIFRGLDIIGGLMLAPFGLERMRDSGEALLIYRRMVSEGLKPSLKTYSTLMVASRKRRDTGTIMYLLKEMESLGLKPNVYTFTICIRVIGRAGKIDDAFGILKRMNDMGCGPDVVTYIVLIDALCNAGILDQAKEIFLRMKSKSHKLDKITYITLLDKFSDHRDLDLVKEFWNEMEADGYAPVVVTFTILIDVLCKVGNLDEAFDMIEDMRKQEVSPNVHTYNTIICGLLRLTRSGDHGEALKTFEKMKARGIVPNVIACNASLYSLAQVGRLNEAKAIINELKMDEAIKLLFEMLENHYEPDVMIINSLIDMLFKAVRVDEAWEMFHKMKEMSLAPSVVTYNILIAGLGKEDQVQKAIELFQSMARHGCHPNTITFNILLDYIYKNDEADLALEMLYKMMPKNCLPDVLTYNTVIYGFIKANRVKNVIWVFHQIKKLFYPDYVTLCTILPGIIKDEQVMDAFKFTQDFIYQDGIYTNRSFWEDLMSGILMEAGMDKAVQFAGTLACSKICKDESILVPLIRNLCRHKKDIIARELFANFTKNMRVIATPTTYNLLIDGLLEIHNTKMAWDLFEEMKSIGCYPDISTYNLLLDACGKFGHIDKLFDVYEEMTFRGCTPNTISQNIVLSGLAKSNNIEKAMNMYYDLISGDFRPTPCTYGPLIDRLLKLGRFEDAKQLFEEMEEYGCKANCVLYNILINGYGKAGDVDTACELFKMMDMEGIRPDLKSYTILVDCGIGV